MARRTGRNSRLPRPRGRRRWTSFVADPGDGERSSRALHEDGNRGHRVRVEHDEHTLLIHLSDEAGGGWTTIAVDRETRAWAIAQAIRQSDAARDAYDGLYEP